MFKHKHSVKPLLFISSPFPNLLIVKSIKINITNIVNNSISFQIWLFCKGAETAVFPLCKDSVLIEETERDINSFANKGLRTLAVAYREVPVDEYEKVAECKNL